MYTQRQGQPHIDPETTRTSVGIVRLFVIGVLAKVERVRICGVPGPSSQSVYAVVLHKPIPQLIPLCVPLRRAVYPVVVIPRNRSEEFRFGLQ